eukprot:5349530-Amphidinium_carterae.1
MEIAGREFGERLLERRFGTLLNTRSSLIGHCSREAMRAARLCHYGEARSGVPPNARTGNRRQGRPLSVGERGGVATLEACGNLSAGTAMLTLKAALRAGDLAEALRRFRANVINFQAMIIDMGPEPQQKQGSNI